jgi:hypothetical protein
VLPKREIKCVPTDGISAAPFTANDALGRSRFKDNYILRELTRPKCLGLFRV